MSKAFHPGLKTGSPFPKTAGKPPSHLWLACEVVLDLNIARKNAAIYPSEHILVLRSTKRAFKSLERFFYLRSKLTLVAVRDSLVADGYLLDRKNPVFREFAVSVHQHGIAAVVFSTGIDPLELGRFLQVLALKPEKTRRTGGIAKAMAEATIPHIHVKGVDYSRFYLTREEEIDPSEPKKENGPAIDPWMAFAADLTGRESRQKNEEEAFRNASLKPADLVGDFTGKCISGDAADQSYDEIIGRHVREISGASPSGEQRYHTLRSLDALIKDLHPRLHERLYAAAPPPRTHGESLDLKAWAQDPMVEKVIRTLHRISEKGEDISPGLAALIHRLADSPQPAVQEPSPQMDLSDEQIESLFHPGQNETAIEEDYARTLDKIEEAATSGGIPEDPTFPISEYTDSLDDDRLDFQITRALIAFLDEDIQCDAYETFSNKVISLIPGFLKDGQFSILLEILQLLRRHGRDKKTPEIRDMAQKHLAVFEDPKFVTEAIAAFESHGKTFGPAASDFLLALGPACLPGLLDLYIDGFPPFGPKILVELLADFGEQAVSLALKRLHGGSPRKIRAAVRLIRKIGSPQSAHSVRTFASHADGKLRMEAIAALLHFQDPWGVWFLRQALRAKDREVIRKAAYLAGRYRISSVVGELLRNVRSLRLFKSDYRLTAGIVQALGRIGHPGAVPTLKRAAETSICLWPRQERFLKEVLFRSLQGYPLDSVRALLQLGVKSDNPKIRQSCRKLLEGENDLR